MDTAYIFGILSIIVTFICGIIAKRIPWFNNNLIPIQNLLIGLLAALIHYLMSIEGKKRIPIKVFFRELLYFNIIH